MHTKITVTDGVHTTVCQYTNYTDGTVSQHAAAIMMFDPFLNQAPDTVRSAPCAKLIEDSIPPSGMRVISHQFDYSKV